MNELTETKPTMNPLDVPSPRPSEIVRNWPDAMWTGAAERKECRDGSVRFCAVGILREVSGEPWPMPDGISRDGRRWWAYCRDNLPFGLSAKQADDLMMVNDREGKEAAADLLESWGL